MLSTRRASGASGASCSASSSRWTRPATPRCEAIALSGRSGSTGSVKNRLHWDVICDDVTALVGRGCTILREPDTEVRWHVLADPAGNEFCVFAPEA
jgi:hypothetical protein